MGLDTDSVNGQRWGNATYLTVAQAALEDIQSGVPIYRAFHAAHLRVLPEEQQLSLDAMRKRNTNGRFATYLREASKIAKRQARRAAVVARKVEPTPTPTPAKPPKNPPTATAQAIAELDAKAAERAAKHAERFPLAGLLTSIKNDERNTRTTPVVWDDAEAATVAREVRRREVRGDTRPLYWVVYDVQKAVLPPERRRLMSGLEQAHYTKKLAALMLRGWEWGVANMPGYLHPGPLPGAEPVETVETTATPVAVDIPPEPVLEVVTRSTAATAAEPVPAPTPAPHPVRGILGASMASVGAVTDTGQVFAAATKDFAMTMAAAMAQAMTGSMDQLLQAHAAHVMAGVEARLAQVSETVGASVASALSLTLAAKVAEGLRENVGAILAQELGGPVGTAPPPAQVQESVRAPQPEAPAPVAPPAPVVQVQQDTPEPPRRHNPAPASEARPPRFVVDVLAMKGNTAKEVRDAVSSRVDVRIIDAVDVPNWEPRRGARVFIAIKFAGHSAEMRCAKFHVKPTRVHGAASAMVIAIERAYREHLETFTEA